MDRIINMMKFLGFSSVCFTMGCSAYSIGGKFMTGSAPPTQNLPSMEESVLAWQSVYTHGATDIALPMEEAAPYFVEPRIGARLQLLLFRPVDLSSLAEVEVRLKGMTTGDVPVDVSGISLEWHVLCAGRILELRFSPALPDRAWYTVEVDGLRDVLGDQITLNTKRTFGVLNGDLDGDAQIGNFDYALDVYRYIGASAYPVISSQEARWDLNGDGLISSADVSVFVQYIVFDQYNLNLVAIPEL